MFIHTDRVNITTTIDENVIYSECDEAIASIITLMNSLQYNEMMATSTGEVITLEDLRRMRGILNGLPYMNIMYNGD